MQFSSEFALNIEVKTKLAKFAQNFTKRVDEHIKIINEILSEGILSEMKLIQLNKPYVKSADKDLAPLDVVYVNIIPSRDQLASSMTTSWQGSLCVVVERSHDD